MPQLQQKKTSNTSNTSMPSTGQKTDASSVSNQQTSTGMVGVTDSATTPLLDGVGGPEGGPKTSTGALDAALSKRGQVEYVDPKHGKGNNKRDFTHDEFDKLVTGSEDISAASCSPFTYWAMENAYQTANPNAEASLIDQKIEGNTTIKDVVNCQSGARKGVKNKDGKAAGWEDLILGNVSEEDAWRGKGVAGAVSKGGLGEEVGLADAKPGDLCQTWQTWNNDKGEFSFGGHSTQVHRVHAKGAAWFGVDGAPLLESVDPSATGFDRMVSEGVCDQSGAVLTQPMMPLWIDACTFRIDETTLATEIGAHTVLTQELIGAHNGGKNADTGESDSGVFTREAEDLSKKNNSKQAAGAERVYLARLNESQWMEYAPATASTHSMNIEPIELRPVQNIQIDHDIDIRRDFVPLPLVDDGGKKKKKRGGRSRKN